MKVIVMYYIPNVYYTHKAKIRKVKLLFLYEMVNQRVAWTFYGNSEASDYIKQYFDTLVFAPSVIL